MIPKYFKHESNILAKTSVKNIVMGKIFNIFRKDRGSKSLSVEEPP